MAECITLIILIICFTAATVTITSLYMAYTDKLERSVYELFFGRKTSALERILGKTTPKKDERTDDEESRKE